MPRDRAVTVRAAIIGLGRWGRSLVNAVQGKSGDIQFAAAYTRTRASAEEFCREKNVPLVDSYEEILANPDIDAVVLATPHSQHAEQVMQAAAARKHIHVQKPLTLDLPSAEAAVDAARKAGIMLAVGFNRRFHPSIVEMRNASGRRPARPGDVDGRRSTPPARGSSSPPATGGRSLTRRRAARSPRSACIRSTT